MKLQNVKDPEKLFEVIDTCTGKVELVTGEGDRLNLKSKLSQLVGLTRLIEGGKITEAFVICDDPVDESRLFRLNMFGNAKHTA